MEKISIYAKIDSGVRQRALVYVTNAKLTENETDTFGKLVEKALDEYMINHPL